MVTRIIATLLVVWCLSLPQISLAAGFIPCGGPNQDPCQACHVIDLTNNVISWLVLVLGTIAAIMIVFAGFKLVTSNGNQRAMEEAKEIMSNMVIGFVIVLVGWMLVDTVLKAVLKEGVYGVWNQVQCVDQPDAVFDAYEYEPRITATGFNNYSFSQGDVNLNVEAIRNSGNVAAMVQTAAVQAGLDSYHQKVFAALVWQESGMCRNKISSAGALGCGQMMLPTAQGLDPSATRERLLNDDAYNLGLSARLFSDLLRMTNGDTRSALAAYNGGPGALKPSRSCLNMAIWECEENPRYEETRNYVSNILSVAGRL